MYYMAVLLFDFDGTLADSLDEAISFANVMLVKASKRPITKDEVRNLGVKAIIKTRNVGRLQLLLFVLFSRHNLSKHIETVDLFPNLKENIIKLSKKNTLGIISSNSKANIVNFLKHHGIKYCFSYIESELSLFGKHKKINSLVNKLGISRNEVAYIGDETRDIEAAKRAGVKSVAVSWGFENGVLLEKSQPDILISKVSSIYQNLKAL